MDHTPTQTRSGHTPANQLTKEQFHQVKAMQSERIKPAAIAKQENLPLKAVLDCWTLEAYAEPVHKPRRPNPLSPFQRHITLRTLQGLITKAAMCREIRALGYTGSQNAVGTFMNPLIDHFNANGSSPPHLLPKQFDLPPEPGLDTPEAGLILRTYDYIAWITNPGRTGQGDNPSNPTPDTPVYNPLIIDNNLYADIWPNEGTPTVMTVIGHIPPKNANLKRHRKAFQACATIQEISDTFMDILIATTARPRPGPRPAITQAEEEHQPATAKPRAERIPIADVWANVPETMRLSDPEIETVLLGVAQHLAKLSGVNLPANYTQVNLHKGYFLTKNTHGTGFALHRQTPSMRTRLQVQARTSPEDELVFHDPLFPQHLHRWKPGHEDPEAWLTRMASEAVAAFLSETS